MKTKKRKYVTTQLESYGSAFGAEITRDGFVTDDPELIKNLEASSDFNVLFFAAPTDADIAKSTLEWANEVLKEEEPEPIEVEPISAGNIDDELEALAEEEQIKADQLKAEEERKEAGRQAQIAYKEKFRPNAAAEAKAKAKAKKSE